MIKIIFGIMITPLVIAAIIALIMAIIDFIALSLDEILW